MNSKDQSALLERMAGKHRATILAAALSDFERLDEAYQTALKSDNSALEEFEKRTTSIEYALGQLNATWQEFSMNTIPKELIVDVINLGKSALEMGQSVGVLKIFAHVMGTIAGLFIQAKGLPWLNTMGAQLQEQTKNTKTLKQKYVDLISEVKDFGGTSAYAHNQTIVLGKKAGAVFSNLTKIIGLVGKTILKSFGFAVAAGVVVSLVSKVAEAFDNAKNKVSNLKTEIEELEGTISGYKSEQEELSSKSVLTTAEKQRLDYLEKQIALEERSLELKKEQQAQAFIESSNRYFDGDTAGVNTEFQDAMDNANDVLKDYENNLELIGRKQSTVDRVTTSLENMSKESIFYEGKLNDLERAQTSLNEAENEQNNILQDAQAALSSMYDQQANYENALNHCTEAERKRLLQEKAQVDATVEQLEVILGLTSTYEDLEAELTRIAPKVKAVEDAFNKAKVAKKLTFEEIDALKEQYPELAAVIYQHCERVEDGYVLEENALTALQDTFAEVKSAQIQTQIDMTQKTLDGVTKRIELYKSEVRAMSLLYGAMSPIGRMLNESTQEEMAGPYQQNAKSGTLNGVLAGSEKYKQYQKDIEEAQNLQKILNDLETELNNLPGLSDTNPGNGDPGNGGSSSSGSGSKKSADIWDKYAHALAKANDEIERYNKVVEITQGKLDLNQSTENRTVELLAEEVQLYDELIASTKAKYKVVNDTLWAQQQGLQKMYTEAAKYMGLDADAVANMTDADLEAYIELKLDEDKANDQKIAHLLNGIIDMRENVHGLHLDWLDMKAEIKELEREEINIRINLQADLEEKFDASREGAKKVLDILEEMEGTETQRAEILGQMAESYESEINSNMQLYAENSEKLLEMAKAGNTESDEYNDLLEHANEIQLRNLDLIKEQLDTRLKQIEAEKELAIRQLETQVYGEQGQDAWEKSRENEIDRLQNQLDALDEDTSEADYLEELEDKEETIRKLEEKLANLQRERTVKQLKQEEDGSWQWEYVVDDRAIAETQAELDDARADLQKTKDDKALEDQKDAIQNRIDAIEQEIEDKNDYYTMEMERLEEHYAKKKELEEQAAQDQIDTLNKQTQDVVNALNKLEQKTGDGLDEVARETDKGMETIADTYSAWCTTIKTQISSWVEEVIREFNRLEAARRAAQEEAASMAPSVASVDGSHANGLKFVESNNYIARLHYGERVLTRQEAAQYNELEEDIKSGKLEAYFNSLREDTAMSFSDAATASVMRTTSMPTTNSNTTSFVIEHLELPEVKDPTDFARVIDNWARGEFGGMAQRARIVKAK